MRTVNSTDTPTSNASSRSTSRAKLDASGGKMLNERNISLLTLKFLALRPDPPSRYRIVFALQDPSNQSAERQHRKSTPNLHHPPDQDSVLAGPRVIVE